MNRIRNKVNLICQLIYQTWLNNKEISNKRERFGLLEKGVFRLHTGDDIREISSHSLVLPVNWLKLAEKYPGRKWEVAVQGNYIHRTYTDNDGAERIKSGIHVSELLLLYYPWYKCVRG